MKSRWFLALIAIIGLALLSSLYVPVTAATPSVKLALGGSGATSWAIGNIAPGNSGTNTVSLSNTGYKDGVVTIWISDIVNSEGVNPESETGDTAEPGELGNYLILHASGVNLSTNFTLPATIGNFPQSAADIRHIYVSPLKALSTLNLQWDWLLPPETGNDVQGDSLSFTTNYLLEEVPPLPLVLSARGATMSLVDTSDPVAMGDELAYKIQVTNQSGTADLHNLTISGLIPRQMVFVSAGGPTEFTVAGQDVRFGPVAELKPGATVEFYVQVKATAAGAAVFNATMRWNEFGEPVINQEGTTVFMPVLSVSALYYVTPAKFEVLSLTIGPVQTKPGEPVSVTYEIANTGGQSGEFTLSIDIPGLLQTSPLIRLEAGQTLAVTLMLPPSNPGTYQVDIGGVTGTLTIGALPPVVPVLLPAPLGMQKIMSGWPITAILAIIAAAALLFFIIIAIRRRRKYHRLRIARAGAVGIVAQTSRQRTIYATRHQKRVAELASAIAREMNLSSKLVKMLLVVGLIREPGSGEAQYPAAQTALQYHERLNGSGFPLKQAGDDILLEARILAVADTAETMSSPRPHRPAMGLDQALEEIKRNSSVLYDTEVVKALVRLVDQGKFKFQTRYN